MSAVSTPGDMGEGIAYEQVDFGTVEVLPPAPASINVDRVRLAPGVGIPVGAVTPAAGEMTATPAA